MSRICCLCETPTRRPAHYLCKDHFKDYGMLRPMPAWLRWAKNARDREEYHETYVAPRHTSLDQLLDNEAFDETRLRPLVGKPRGRPKKSATGVVLMHHR